MAKYKKFSGIIYGHFHTEHILLVEKLNGILVDPMAESHTIILRKIGSEKMNPIPGRTILRSIRWQFVPAVAVHGPMFLFLPACRDMRNVISTAVFGILIGIFDCVFCLGHHLRFVISIENAFKFLANGYLKCGCLIHE